MKRFQVEYKIHDEYGNIIDLNRTVDIGSLSMNGDILILSDEQGVMQELDMTITEVDISILSLT